MAGCKYALLQLFLGAVAGTSAGTTIFNAYGWRANAGLSLGMMGWMVFILLLRGPHETRYTWFGYSKGLRPYRMVVEKQLKAEDLEKSSMEAADVNKDRSGVVSEEK